MPDRREPFLTNFGRIETLYRTGRVEDGSDCRAPATRLSARPLWRAESRHRAGARPLRRRSGARQARPGGAQGVPGGGTDAHCDDVQHRQRRRPQRRGSHALHPGGGRDLHRSARTARPVRRPRCREPDLPAGGLDPQPLGPEGAHRHQRPHDHERSEARGGRAPRAGPAAADRHAARPTQFAAGVAGGRARRRRRCGDAQGNRQDARRAHQGARRHRSPFSGLCRSDRSEASDVRADQGDAQAGRGAAVVLLRPRCELRLGDLAGRQDRVRRAAARARRRSRPRSRSCARRSSRRRR